MVTLGKKGTLHARRTAAAYLHQDSAVKKLFDEIAPRAATRQGGYTRIVKLGARKSDSAPMAVLEWVDSVVVEATPEEPSEKPKAAKKKSAPKKDAE
jgi:large subunit ribosomal protein L17